MANDVTKDPMVLDTVAAAINTGRKVNIFKEVEWVTPALAGDLAVLLDADGNTVCNFKCPAAVGNMHIYFGEKGHPFTGPLNLTTLTSGSLRVLRV